MKVAAVQLISGDNYAENMERIEKRVTEAAKGGADLVVLPEYCALYGSKISPTPKEQNQFLSDMSTLAIEHRVWLVAGTFPLQTDANHKPYSSCVIFDSQGEIQGQYNKIHLFDADIPNDGLATKQAAYRESDYFTPGLAPLLVDTPWGRVGIAICFDLRFPRLFAYFADTKCDFIIIPAAFTATTGRAHWEILVRARAIETQAYVVAVNQGGSHFNGTETYGGTMIINPWGEVLSSLAVGEGVLIEQLDRTFIAATRSQIPLIPKLIHATA
ncbi:carbon-nitrogen hydrolase family protein [Saccharophagus degradans]|uniref:Carbon-nitrogen hydrolase family protein n=1 Tax=Saccharophagus degradans TaxID=86304 RepID=A0AAW7X0V6_9GAMM|nr:carbon-nitrogen hydrolase family protein [Saccharophagus degradans]MDO6421248.1 carbon-nitrogen hydrolase family protein [Saccharophagus degradans]MDO6605841.1 carbon-nitrogen hydrolase family protein [Saccharophagus degradans]